MTASMIAANVIFSAGWVAVGAAAVYTRRRKAAREAEAQTGRADAVPAETWAPAAPRNPHLETIWTSDLAALASAIQNATPTPELEQEEMPVPASRRQRQAAS
jgi:hypothetical protein